MLPITVQGTLLTEIGEQVSPTGRSADWRTIPKIAKRPPRPDLESGAVFWVFWQHIKSPVLHWPLPPWGAGEAVARIAKEATMMVFKLNNMVIEIGLIILESRRRLGDREETWVVAWWVWELPVYRLYRSILSSFETIAPQIACVQTAHLAGTPEIT